MPSLTFPKDRADWRKSLEAMREEGERNAEKLEDLMEIAASCDAAPQQVFKPLDSGCFHNSLRWHLDSLLSPYPSLSY